jgi:hypothetical protein
MLEGGCKQCGKLCSTGIDSYMIERDKIVEVPASTVNIICYSCYDKYYSKEAKRNKKLEELLKKSWWKRILKIK